MLFTSVWICPFFIKTQWLLIGFPISSVKFRSNSFDNVSGSYTLAFICYRIHKLSDPYAIWSIRYPIHTLSDPYANQIHTLSDPYAIQLIRYPIHMLSDPYAIWSICYPIHMISDPYAIQSIRYLIHTLSDPYISDPYGCSSAEVPINLSRKTIKDKFCEAKLFYSFT